LYESAGGTVSPAAASRRPRHKSASFRPWGPPRILAPMDYQTIEVTPCSPVIGAEIRGVDLREPLSDDQWKDVRHAFHQPSVIFFRDQKPMTPEQHVIFGKRFGPLHFHPAAPHLEGHPEVFVIHAHKDSKIAN